MVSPAPLGQLGRMRLGIVEQRSFEHHFGAEGARLLHFHRRGVARHHDHRRDAQAFRVIGDALRVVAGRGGDDAAGALLGR